MKVSSRNDSSIYTRLPENVTNIWYSPILGHSRRINVCVVPPLGKKNLPHISTELCVPKFDRSLLLKILNTYFLKLCPYAACLPHHCFAAPTPHCPICHKRNFETNVSILVYSLATWSVFVKQRKRDRIRIICFYIPQCSIT